MDAARLASVPYTRNLVIMSTAPYPSALIVPICSRCSSTMRVIVVKLTSAAIRKKNTGKADAIADKRSALSLYSAYPGYWRVRSVTYTLGSPGSASFCSPAASSTFAKLVHRQWPSCLQLVPAALLLAGPLIVELTLGSGRLPTSARQLLLRRFRRATPRAVLPPPRDNACSISLYTVGRMISSASLRTGLSLKPIGLRINRKLEISNFRIDCERIPAVPLPIRLVPGSLFQYIAGLRAKPTTV